MTDREASACFDGALVRPGTTALAWAPDPTAVGDADRAAAYATCTEDIPFVGTGGVATGDARPEVDGAPATPAQLPPLVALELHGNGGAPVAKAAVVGAAVSPGPSPVAKAAVVGAAVTPGRRRRF